MNFKFKTLSMLLAGGALALASCQSDEPLVNGGEYGDGTNSGKKVYVSAGLSLPTSIGSRSATDGKVDDSGDYSQDGDTNSNANPDYEYGYDYENDVRTMILIFADKEDKFLCYSIVSGIEKAPTGSANYEFEVLAEVKYDDLQEAYTKVLTGDKTVNVYAYCNYTSQLETYLKSVTPGSQDWVDWTGEIQENPSSAGSSPNITNTIWAQRSFLMTNYKKVKTTFPDDISDWDEYADKSNPFKVAEDGVQTNDLLPIQVERSAGRIDFRDGSQDGEKKSGKANTYIVTTTIHVTTTVNGGDNQPPTVTTTTSTANLFNVKLTRMSLVNMSNKFYYLRRVSNDDDGMSNPVLLGYETSKNYIVDTDAAAKSTGIKAKDNATYFNFPLYNADGTYNNKGWYSDNIDDVLKGTQDTWTGGKGGAGSYKIWRYVTENTIPGANMQKTAQSTGVVFKGKIIPGAEINSKYQTSDQFGQDEYYVSDAVRSALANFADGAKVTDPAIGSNLPVLYSFDGFLYAGWEELIEKAAEDGIGGRLYTRVKTILEDYKLENNKYSKGGTGEKSLDMETAYLIVTMPTDEVLEGLEETNKSLYDDYMAVKDLSIEMTDDDMSAVAADHDITVYIAENEEDGDGWGYYCYYFYWNRHNDNGKSGLMGPMEFATVRNNVYKLAVTKINQFGHPRNIVHDPDPEYDDRDDEEPTRYIEVQVEVLPWVVRVNDIEF